MPAEFRRIEKYCLECGKKLLLKNTRDIKRKKFCSRKCLGTWTVKRQPEDHMQKMIILANTPESNLKKSYKGSSHPRWIKDRTKLKNKRFYFEEKQFIMERIKEADYKCSLTNEGGQMSVHHLDSVHLFPKKKFDKNNTIVIKKDIHLDFHRKYGFQWATKKKWEQYLRENNYV
ncbi:hypothetical protein AYK24_00130 [Thermoplasmatales archaeon SG8-52-4]|nr:MAG: hypothetical protein AYK24_00130 [Thermoplasmatales archaeon SG8-52-4]